MHSREFYRMLAAMLALTAAAAIGQGLAWGVPGAATALVLGGALAALAALYTLRRYRRIGQLSEYLAQVYTGGQPPRLSGQTPGELSALQDDLYKITSILQQQAAALEADKRFLADSLSDIAHQLRTRPFPPFCCNATFCGRSCRPGTRRKALPRSRRRRTASAGWWKRCCAFPGWTRGWCPLKRRSIPPGRCSSGRWAAWRSFI